MWYNRMADTLVPTRDKTFDKFSENFKSTSFPFNIKATGRYELSKLAQKFFYCLDGLTEDDFQIYITDFQISPLEQELLMM